VDLPLANKNSTVNIVILGSV